MNTPVRLTMAEAEGLLRYLAGFDEPGGPLMAYRSIWREGSDEIALETMGKPSLTLRLVRVEDQQWNGYCSCVEDFDCGHCCSAAGHLLRSAPPVNPPPKGSHPSSAPSTTSIATDLIGRSIPDLVGEIPRSQPIPESRVKAWRSHESESSFQAFSSMAGSTRSPADMDATPVLGTGILLTKEDSIVETESRGSSVHSFNSHDGAVVILTSASGVVLCDPWWNPAGENHAVDRTHRIGRSSAVSAYRPVVNDSIERKNRPLQRTQSTFADDLLGEEQCPQSLSIADFRFLFSDAEADV